MRPPISILVVIALWGVIGTLAVLGEIVRGEFLMALGRGALGAWMVFAMWRMSRWPLLVGLGIGIAVQAWRVLMEQGNYDHYPLLGQWAVIIPGLIVTAMIVPHWKQLNWSFVGVDRPAGRVANALG